MANNRKSIPEIRARLYELAELHNLPELAELADQTFRRPSRKRAQTRSPKLTPSMAAAIRQYDREHPGSHQQDIANVFGVNHGRISEALNNEI